LLSPLVCFSPDIANLTFGQSATNIAAGQFFMVFGNAVAHAAWSSEFSIGLEDCPFGGKTRALEQVGSSAKCHPLAR
jgi:hypothetical protein